MGRPCRCCGKAECCCSPWIVALNEITTTSSDCGVAWDFGDVGVLNTLAGSFQVPTSQNCESGGCPFPIWLRCWKVVNITSGFTVIAKMIADVERHNSGFDYHDLWLSPYETTWPCPQLEFHTSTGSKQRINAPLADGFNSDLGGLLNRQSSNCAPPCPSGDASTPCLVDTYEKGFHLQFSSDNCFTGCSENTVKSVNTKQQLPAGCYMLYYQFNSIDHLYHMDDPVSAFSCQFISATGEPIRLHPELGRCTERDFIIWNSELKCKRKDDNENCPPEEELITD